MIIEYYRLREGVLPPVRSNPSDAGLDVFYCPENGESKTLSPGENAVLQTGLKF